MEKLTSNGEMLRRLGVGVGRQLLGRGSIRTIASNERFNSLHSILVESIKATGPIPVSSFMKQCLTNPEYGYYTSQQGQFGHQGDFVTSPEISSIFGETVGIWLYLIWLLQGKPDNVNLIEFGPGNGTLMADVLRCFNRLSSGFKLKVQMVELSPKLRLTQFSKLCNDEIELLIQRDEDGMFESVDLHGNRIEWLETELDIVIDTSSTNYIIAHEFFDALPIQKFVKTDQGWREYLVDYIDDNFRLVLSPYETLNSMIPSNYERFKDLAIGSKIEICPESHLYATKMSHIINSNKDTGPVRKGGVLICDYGLENIPLDTLRGIMNHKFVSPFTNVGKIDLTLDVDFTNLSKVFTENGCISYGPVEQGDWLHELGIGYRVDQLLSNIEDESRRQDLIQSYHRLVDKDKMGKIYKFLGVLPIGSRGVFPVGFGGGIVEP